MNVYDQTRILERILGSVRPYVGLSCSYYLPIIIISQGTMGYPLCDPVDAVVLAGPTGHCLRSNEKTRRNLG